MNFEKISDTEYKLGPNRVSLIEDNIIFVIAKGEQTSDMAMEYTHISHEISSRVKGRIHYLIDINECGKNSPEARDTWKILSAEEKTGKAATFGMNPVARVLASFVIGTYKNNNIGFFKTKDEAIDWLKKD